MDDAHSLKDKRHYVKGLKDRLRAKFNVAVAEIDHQEVWQRGLIAAVTVSPDQAFAEQQAVGILLGGEGRHIGRVAIGSVIGSKDGVRAQCRVEAQANVLSGNAPAIGRLVAGRA